MDRQKAERLLHCVSILKEMEAQPDVTRREISEKTGISLMTIGKLCALFENAELMKSHKEEKSEIGRRAMRCVLSPALSFCVLDCSGAVSTLTLYDEHGKTTLTLMHGSSAGSLPADVFGQFLDRMTDMLSRIRFRQPGAVVLIHPGVFDRETGVLRPETPGCPSFDVRSKILNLFPSSFLKVVTPAAAAEASMELHGSPEQIAVLLGNSTELAFPNAEEPYSAYTAVPRSLRVDGNTFGERLDMLGAPDRASLDSLFSAVSAFFPGKGVRVFLLARNGGALSRSEINDVVQPLLPGRVIFSDDPSAELSEGARLLLLCDILKKHI